MRWFSAIVLLLCLLDCLSCSNPTCPDSDGDEIWTETQQYTDKLFEKTFVFTPKDSEIGIKFSSNVTLAEKETLVNEFKLTPKVELREERRYNAFQLPSASTVKRIGPRILRNDKVTGALPIYVDQEGYSRYVDPEWITVQFVDGVSEARADSIFSSWEVVVIRDYWTPGYYMITVPGDMTVFDAVRKYMDVPEIKFTEPASYGFDDWP